MPDPGKVRPSGLFATDEVVFQVSCVYELISFPPQFSE